MNTAEATVLTLLTLTTALQAQTYTRDIAPIVYAHCSPCHRPGEGAPFPLLTYADIRKRARMVSDVTQSRYMPPWQPTAQPHAPFQNDISLTPQQIALIAAWVHNGAPEGDPADLPPAAHFIQGWQLGKPDLILHMSRPYQLQAGGTDVFRNFILPTGLQQIRYVRAFELRPGNKRVVHHANVVLDRSRLLRKRDAQDGQPGFSGMDIETEAVGEFDPDSHFLFWKPGTPAQQEPDGMSWRLNPGTDLVINLHLQPSGKPETVDAEVGLYFTPDPPTRRPMLLQLEHDGAIDIPPNSSTFTVTDHFKLPIAVDLLAVYPHAHYLGKKIEAWATLPDGKRLSLIQINQWNINWQATYIYRDPIKLPAGTTLEMRIGYENTTDKRVRTGNRSEDEMGHLWFQVLPSQPSESDQRLILQQAYMERRIEKYPADFSAHFNLGAALLVQDHPNEALPHLAEATRLKPDSTTALNTLGAAYSALERFEEAARYFTAALKADPTYQNASYNLARARAAQGNIPAAIAHLEAHLQTTPDDAEAHEFLASLEARSGNLKAALPHLERAAQIDPNNPAYLINLGAALAQSGNPAAAIPIFEQALKLDPENQAAKDNLTKARGRPR
jgi:tetratricopeptide (TPR) repeat protein